jgi:hypothetical protein
VLVDEADADQHDAEPMNDSARQCSVELANDAYRGLGVAPCQCSGRLETRQDSPGRASSMGSQSF